MLKELWSTSSGYIAKGSGKALRKPYDNHRKSWMSVGCFLELKICALAVFMESVSKGLVVFHVFRLYPGP